MTIDEMIQQYYQESLAGFVTINVSTSSVPPFFAVPLNLHQPATVERASPEPPKPAGLPLKAKRIISLEED